MSNQNDTPKPVPAEQPSPSGLDETACYASRFFRMQLVKFPLGDGTYQQCSFIGVDSHGVATVKTQGGRYRTVWDCNLYSVHNVESMHADTQSPKIMSNQNDTPKPVPAEQPSPSGLDETLVRLSFSWRELADLCDSEIARTKTEPPTLIMSDGEMVRYEQAACTYRFCADALDSETNADVDAAADEKSQPKQTLCSAE